MKQNADRRLFLCIAATAALAPFAPEMKRARSCSTMATRIQTAQGLFVSWKEAFKVWTARGKPFDVVENGTETGLWEQFLPTPSTREYYAVRDRARDAVEAVFMTPPQTEDDELMVLVAFDLYREIAPSSFALQTARDLFTPERFQTYPLDNIRKALLADPEEDFAKTGIPSFLQVMRARYRGLSPAT